jgi:hypothetical protein
MLEVAESKLVLFQAYFEHYEGLAAVRTVDRSRSRVCLLCTRDTFPDCLKALEALQNSIPWRVVSNLTPGDLEKYLGWGK